VPQGHNQIGVSLLRSASYPDPGADEGRHDITLSILPHTDDLTTVLAEADALNRPARVGNLPERVAPARIPTRPVAVLTPGVEVSALKPADDGSGDLILRFNEALGRAVMAEFELAPGISGARVVNIYEDPIDDTADVVDHVDSLLRVRLRAFGLLTLRLTVDR
jgi:alpha-mannosidase